MALWTPYLQDAPLDLTLRRHWSGSSSPEEYVEDPVTYLSPVEEYQQFRYEPQPLRHVYPYSRAATEYTVPVMVISPESIGSTSSVPQPAASSSGSSHYDADPIFGDEEYKIFEAEAFKELAERNGGSLLGNNPRMRRSVQTAKAADDLYMKQRDRNNMAAKQSRDRRKMREVANSIKVTYLKKKLGELRKKPAGRCARCEDTLHIVYRNVKD